MQVITLSDVSKAFRGHPVIRSADLVIESASVTGIRGRNGSGKSVLLKLLCGFLRPDEGEVVIHDSFLSDSRVFPDRFGVLINGPAFIGSLSAMENLEDLAAIRGRATRTDLESVLRLVGLDPASKAKARTFSAGMKQKLGLAQALMEEPQVLVLDEPFTALDDETVVRMKRELRALNDQGVTVILTSHDESDFRDLSARVVVLADGRLHEDGR